MCCAKLVRWEFCCDGDRWVLDALPVGEQELIMKMIIEGTSITNPKEMAHHILEQVLECSGEIPLDDMTIMVVGMWSLAK